MAGEPCISGVAATGSMPRKKDSPALPVATAEQARQMLVLRTPA